MTPLSLDWHYELQKEAYLAVRYALWTRQLRRPMVCTKCCRAGKIIAHHYKGYASEHRLDIQWLCQQCHLLAHSRLLHGDDERLNNDELEQMLDPINAMPYRYRKWYRRGGGER